MGPSPSQPLQQNQSWELERWPRGYEHLLYNHHYWSPDLNTHKTSQAPHPPVTPAPTRAEPGGSLGLAGSQPIQTTVSPGFKESPCLKRMGGG